MRIEDLRTFITIIDEGNVSKAGKALGVKQQTISKRLAALEGELGHELLKRDRGGCFLTPFGKEVQKHAKKILKAQEKLERSKPALAVIELEQNLTDYASEYIE